MAEDSEHYVSAANIPREALTITLWVFFGFTTLLLVFRLGIRGWLHRQLFWDDVFAIAAFVFLIAQLVTITIITPAIYQFVEVLEGVAHVHDFDDQLTAMMRGLLVHSICYTFCIYLVKGSFMSLFWRLVRNMETFRKVWWVITVLCVVSLCVTLALLPVTCTNYHAHGCDGELIAMRDLITLRFGASMDIITDVLIMGLPISFVLKSHLPLAQKLGLVVLFALGFCIIGISVLRVITLNNEVNHPATSWLLFWGTLESAIAVMTSCFAAFKSLFTVCKRSSSYPRRPTYQRTTPKASRKYGDMDICLTQRMGGNDGYSNNTTVNHEAMTVVTSSGPDALKWADDDSREEILHRTEFEVRFEPASELKANRSSQSSTK